MKFRFCIINLIDDLLDFIPVRSGLPEFPVSRLRCVAFVSSEVSADEWLYVQRVEATLTRGSAIHTLTLDVDEGESSGKGNLQQRQRGRVEHCRDDY